MSLFGLGFVAIVLVAGLYSLRFAQTLGSKASSGKNGINVINEFVRVWPKANAIPLTDVVDPHCTPNNPPGCTQFSTQNNILSVPTGTNTWYTKKYLYLSGTEPLTASASAQLYARTTAPCTFSGMSLSMAPMNIWPEDSKWHGSSTHTVNFGNLTQMDDCYTNPYGDGWNYFSTDVFFQGAPFGYTPRGMMLLANPTSNQQYNWEIFEIAFNGQYYQWPTYVECDPVQGPAEGLCPNTPYTYSMTCTSHDLNGIQPPEASPLQWMGMLASLSDKPNFKYGALCSADGGGQWPCTCTISDDGTTSTCSKTVRFPMAGTYLMSQLGATQDGEYCASDPFSGVEQCGKGTTKTITVSSCPGSINKSGAGATLNPLPYSVQNMLK